MKSYFEENIILHNNGNIELLISELLKECGVPLNVKGYDYLCAAIAMVHEDPNNIHALTKLVYPAIAKRYSTGTPSVERNMRTAISLSSQRGDPIFLRNLLGPKLTDRCKPTNGEFIAAAARYIKAASAAPDLASIHGK